MTRYLARAAAAAVGARPPPGEDAPPADVIRVFLADGSCKNVRVDAHTTVRRIVEVVLEALGVDRLSFGRFALRLNACAARTSGAHSDDCHWLAPALRFAQLSARYLRADRAAQLRFELRLRFLAADVFEMYQTEMAAFLYLYEQLTADYLRHVAWKIGVAKALEMAALMLRKRFPNLNSQNVEKKLDFSAIEREGGFARYLPETIVINTKRKQLQKTLVAEVRRAAALSELDCVFRFMRHLADVTPFHVEVFRAAFGPKWQNAVDIHVGPNAGIAYLCENTRALVQLTALRDISALCVRRVDMRASSMALVELRLVGDTIPLTFTLPTVNIAESFAHLVDGYRTLLLAEDPSAGSRPGAGPELNCGTPPGASGELSPLLSSCGMGPALPRSPVLGLGKGSALERLAVAAKRHSLPPDGAIMRALCASLAADAPAASTVAEEPDEDLDANEDQDQDDTKSLVMDVNTSDLRLERLLGEGQFGNVYSALYRVPGGGGATAPVAVKVCKAAEDVATARALNKHLLDEARTMARFRHAHVVALVGAGVRRGAPPDAPSVWLVMELAGGGELRAYLQRERAALDAAQLTAFARQLADALAYMHRRRYVHGDVAARNCLVALAPRRLKLSDFGLSRRLDHVGDVYTAPHGKLPIKWLPPESISRRAFSTASDVFMFGVCAWEMFAWGGKPWPGVRNHDVVVRVERGERLRKPDACPEAVYALLMACWSASPARRPRARDALAFLRDVGAQLERGVPSPHVRVPIFQIGRENGNANNSNRDSKTNDGNTDSEHRNLLEIERDTVGSKAFNPLTARRRSSSASAGWDRGETVEGKDRAGSEAPSASDSGADDGSAEALSRLLETQRAACAADDRWLLEAERARSLTPDESPHNSMSKHMAEKVSCGHRKYGINHDDSNCYQNNNNKNNNNYTFNNKGMSGDDNYSNNESGSNCNDISCEDNKSDNNNNSSYGNCSGGAASWRASLSELSDGGGGRAGDALFHALCALVGAIGALSRRYSAKMPADEFAEKVQDIHDKCAEVLAQGDASSEGVSEGPDEDDESRRVALVRRLVESDARRLRKAAQRAAEYDGDAQMYERDFHRVDALRHAHAMALDGKSLLEAVDAARRRPPSSSPSERGGDCVQRL